jgi:glycosyltransferase involved in cell wall biosynthesis
LAETPRVSVLVPCCDLGEFLDEAVGSVLAQTFQDFEIVVVDDGSTDAATTALLADYRRPKTRVLRVPHGGVSAARNHAIAATTGPYLCALDADDRLEPTYLAKTVERLDADPSVTFVSCWLRAFGDEEWDWTPDRCDLPGLLWEDTVLTASLVRRAAVVAAGGYDTRMPYQGAEDWDLWLTLVGRGHRGVIIPEVLFNYRRRADSLSTVAWNGPGHVPLADYRVDKHADLYRAHLIDVLLHQDEDIATLLRKNDEVERYVASNLEPLVASQRAELTALQARLTRAPADRQDERLRELESSLRSADAEIAALRASASWRITGPLRAAYGWWLQRRGAE